MVSSWARRPSNTSDDEVKMMRVYSRFGDTADTLQNHNLFDPQKTIWVNVDVWMIHFLWQQLDIVFWLKILARSDRRLSELSKSCCRNHAVLVALFALCTFWLCELPGVQRHSQHQRPRQRVGVRTCELRGLQGACKSLCQYCNGSGPL